MLVTPALKNRGGLFGVVRAWLLALLLLVPGVRAEATFLLEDAAGDNTPPLAGTDLRSMLVEADGRWVNLTLTLDAMPAVSTKYQLDVMPAGFQIYAFCTLAPEGGASCDGSKIPRNPEQAPGPGAVQPKSFPVAAESRPAHPGLFVQMPVAVFPDPATTPIEVLRATSGNGVSYERDFLYPDRADLARVETTWWMPSPMPAPSNVTVESASEPAPRPPRESPSPGLALGLLLAAGVAGQRRR